MDFRQINTELFDASKSSDFAGYDPFDGLNSRLFNYLPVLKKGLFGLAWIQTNKRSSLNLRPLLGVPKARNPKGVALFILGMLEDYKSSKDERFLREAKELADWLLTQRSDPANWGHACWGYHFDWNARAFYVPKGKPNIITTIYVAQALYALGEALQQEKYIEIAFDAANMIVEKLYTQADGRTFFAYIPGEQAFVHNASLWGAAWVAFVADKTQNQAYKSMALKVARQSVNEQREDGAWVYGARHHHQFIDGFHTGYNLEALDMIRAALKTDEFDHAIAKGLAFYKKELIEEDGTAKYYHNNRYPLDMHSVTQAVITLLKVSGSKEDAKLANKIIDRSIQSLYLSDKKRFAYQKHKNFTNKVDYMRWTQAWVYYAFAMFNRFSKEN